MTANVQGRDFLGAPNLTDFGFPSNAVITSGELQYSLDTSTGLVVSIARMPHVVLDLCAALS